jgi:hypothetical protein
VTLWTQLLPVVNVISTASILRVTASTKATDVLAHPHSSGSIRLDSHTETLVRHLSQYNLLNQYGQGKYDHVLEQIPSHE